MFLFPSSSCKEYKTALEELTKTTAKTGGDDTSQAIRYIKHSFLLFAVFSQCILVKQQANFFFFFAIYSAGESRAKNSPAKPSDSSMSQLNRSSVDADPLSKPNHSLPNTSHLQIACIIFSV